MVGVASRGLALALVLIAFGASTIASAEQNDSSSDLSGAEDQSITAGNKQNAEVPSDAQAVTPTNTTSHRSRLLDEIVVTAQKREENSKEVPVSVTAFSSEKLDVKVVLNVMDLPKITPGLHINETLGFSAMFLRGIGSDAFILGDPLVVTYIDDVYFPFSAGQMADFGSVESIEVLKGPQGTLFGRNALGGAIRTKTQDPSFSEYQASFKYHFGSLNTHNLAGRVSVPIFDKLAVSVSGLRNVADSHRKLLHTDNFVPIPQEEQTSWRAKLFFEPFDWVQLRLNYAYTDQDGASSMATNTHPSLVGALLGITPQDPRNGGKNDHEIIKDTEVTTVFGGMTFFTPWADVKILGSDQEVIDINIVDFDASDRPIATFTGLPGFAETTTAEIQIISNDQSPASDWLRWIAGVYYFDSRAGFNPGILSVNATDLTAYGVDLSALTTPLGDLLGPLNLPGLSDPFAALSEDTTLHFRGVLLTESLAYYAQADIDFTEWLTLTIGARYQTEERAIELSNAAIRLPGMAPVVYQSFSADTDPNLRDTTSNFDPKISISVRPGDGWLGEEPLLYASAQTATTSLTYNSINITDQPEKVKATEILAYEVGIKTRFMDGLIDVNAAVFQYEIDNPQVQVVSLQAGGAVLFENAEGQRIRGAEFETLFVLLPELTDNGLIFTASGTYLDAIYTSYKDGSGYNEETGMFETGQDYTGNRSIRAPEFSFAAGLSYTLFTGMGPLELGVDYYYNAGYSYLAQGTDLATEPAYSTVGANLNFLIEEWGVRVAVFGRNILNEDYNLSRHTTDFGTSDLPAPLATYGLQLKWGFDYER